MANVWKQFKEWGGYDHLNKEGFPSYSRPIDEQVLSVLMTGSTANPHGEEVDYLIAFTDNEEWVRDPFRVAWKKYTMKVAPEARAYLVTLLPYGDAPTPPEDRNVHYIYGWSDNALKYIAAPDPEVQVEAVRQLELD